MALAASSPLHAPRKHIHPQTRARHVASALPTRGFYGKKADTREKNPFSDAQLPDPSRSEALYLTTLSCRL